MSDIRPPGPKLRQLLEILPTKAQATLVEEKTHPKEPNMLGKHTSRGMQIAVTFINYCKVGQPRTIIESHQAKIKSAGTSRSSATVDKQFGEKAPQIRAP